MRLFGWKDRTTFALLLKCLGVFSFLGICIAVVACGNTNQVAPGTPVATITINLNQSNSSPTPPLKDYYCGAWATNTTPAYGPNNTVNVYAKFTHTGSDNNPVGVGGATAVARILWPDGSVDTQTVQTTSDGLAVFTILIRPSALNHEVLIPVTFTTPDGQHTCTTPAAFFVAVVVSPTATPSPSPGQGGNGTPTGSPSPGGNGTPTASPTKKPGH